MPLNILFLSHKFYPDIGGIEVNSEVLARAFSEAGHHVRLLTWSEDTTEKVFPFAVIRHPNTRKLFREHAWADLVFENNPCLRLAWPGLFFGRPSIIALNTWLFDPNSRFDAQGWLKYRWLKRAYKVISVSDAVRRNCWPAATVIENPYRANQFKVLPDVHRTTDFVFLGRLVSQKGVDQAILALHRLLSLAQEGNALSEKLSLTIIGDGPERGKLECLVADLDLTDYVSFTGFLQGEALTRCLNRHRFLIAPSISEEAFGNVVLEGIACGCLPIVSNSGGLPEAVGKAGLVFDHGNVDVLVACIQKVLHNEALVEELHAASPKHLAAHHPVIIAQRYLEVIEAAGMALEANQEALGRNLVADNDVMPT